MRLLNKQALAAIRCLAPLQGYGVQPEPILKRNYWVSQEILLLCRW
jgi:hypothetical protein